MQKHQTLLLLLLLNMACITEQKSTHSYLQMIGDITEDTLIDDPDFQLCSGDSLAVQYYALREKPYKKEKIAIERIFAAQYDSEEVKKETGWIRIRFLVNCEGKTGRFRVLGMNKNYQEKEFDQKISDQLLQITKSLDQWKGFKIRTRPLDYYNYLTFKIVDGEIKEILP